MGHYNKSVQKSLLHLLSGPNTNSRKEVYFSQLSTLSSKCGQRKEWVKSLLTNTLVEVHPESSVALDIPGCLTMVMDSVNFL